MKCEYCGRYNDKRACDGCGAQCVPEQSKPAQIAYRLPEGISPFSQAAFDYQQALLSATSNHVPVQGLGEHQKISDMFQRTNPIDSMLSGAIAAAGWNPLNLIRGRR